MKKIKKKTKKNRHITDDQESSSDFGESDEE